MTSATTRDVQRAVLNSQLPAPARQIVLTLASLADFETAEIPVRFTPSLTDLANKTGLGRSTCVRELNRLELLGWVHRSRPDIHKARTEHAKTSYRLAIGASPTAGLVPQKDQPDQPEPDTASATAGPGLVPQRDQASPRAGHIPLVPASTNQPPSSSELALPADPEREDVEQACRHLADRIEANGSKRPTVTSRWRNAARLLIDRDGRTLEQVLAAIDWCQNDEFWRSNILSMPKLREKYDQLRLAAQRARAPTSVNGNRDMLARAMERAVAADRVESSR